MAYHAQQCAEKYLKAFLVFHDFPHTHDIGHLLKLGETVSPWDKAVYQAEELTPYAVSARYPGEDETVASEDAIRAVEIAISAISIINAALQRDGLTRRAGEL